MPSMEEMTWNKPGEILEKLLVTLGWCGDLDVREDTGEDHPIFSKKSNDAAELYDYIKSGGSYMNPPIPLDPTVADDFYSFCHEQGIPCVITVVTDGPMAGQMVALIRDCDSDLANTAYEQAMAKYGVFLDGTKKIPESEVSLLTITRSAGNDKIYEHTTADPVMIKSLTENLRKDAIMFAKRVNEDKSVTFYALEKDKEKLDFIKGQANIRYMGKSGEMNWREDYHKIINAEKALSEIDVSDGHFYVIDASNPYNIIEINKSADEMTIKHYMEKDGEITRSTPLYSTAEGKNIYGIYKREVGSMQNPVVFSKEEYTMTKEHITDRNDMARGKAGQPVYISKEERMECMKEARGKNLYLKRLGNEFRSKDGYDKDFEASCIEELKSGGISLEEFLYVPTDNPEVDFTNAQMITNFNESLTDSERTELINNIQAYYEEIDGSFGDNEYELDQMDLLQDYEDDRYEEFTFTREDVSLTPTTERDMDSDD